MGRYKEAPWGYDCPYKNACPHLGMSTTWASHLVRDLEGDRFRDGHSWIEAKKEVRTLSEENEALSARVADLEGRLKQQHRLRFKPNRKPKEPPKGPKDGAGAPRKRGAPLGHSPWRRRKPDAICCRIDQGRKDKQVSSTAAKRHIPRLQRILDALCKAPLTDAEAGNLRQRLTDPKRDALRLFTFLEVDGMAPTNNHAEPSLRLPVIFREISFGSRSLLGAQAMAENLSLLTTAKRLGRNQIALLRCIFLRGPDAPLSMLYSPDTIPPWDSS